MAGGVSPSAVFDAVLGRCYSSPAFFRPASKKHSSWLVGFLSWIAPKTSSMSNTVDINRVFTGSVSEVSLDALSKKGFRQVKVLNQANVMRLIADSVDKVLAERAEEITAHEREKVIGEARSQFESMARDRIQKERGKLEELELINRSLQEEVEGLKRRSSPSIEVQAERDQAVARASQLEKELGDAQAQLATLQSTEQQSGQQEAVLQEEVAQHAAELEKLRAALQEATDEANRRAGQHQAELEAVRREGVSLQEKELESRKTQQEEAVVAQRRAAELEGALVAKTRELEEARASTPQVDPGVSQVLAKLTERLESVEASGLGGLKETLSGISDKISKVAMGGGGAEATEGVDEAALESFFSRSGEDDLESNVSKVNVREAKAGAVKGALAKLKQLQKGGEDGE